MVVTAVCRKNTQNLTFYSVAFYIPATNMFSCDRARSLPSYLTICVTALRQLEIGCINCDNQILPYSVEIFITILQLKMFTDRSL